MSRHRTLAILGLCAAPVAAQTVLYQVPGDSTWSRAGRSLAALGDLDADGVQDFAVGMPLSSFAGPDQGGVKVVSGSTGAQLYAVHGSTPYGLFGNAVGSGDVDADGVADLIVGAEQANGSTGSAFVFSGTTQALLYTFHGTQPYDQFGYSVAGAGDVDGDGHEDILIGAPFYEPYGTLPGYAEVYSGADGTRLWRWDGPGPGMQFFGNAVAGAGDIDGDKHDDVIVTASTQGNGVAYVFSGRTGLPLHTITPTTGFEQFGWSVAGGRDVDGDLVPDLVVGGISWGGGRGRASVWSGASGAMLAEFTGTLGSQLMGAAVAWIDDLDGDGLPEVAVGSYDDPAAPGSSLGGSLVQIFPGLGGPELVAVHGDASALHLGIVHTSILGLGDVDGDGQPDFAAGADQGQSSGTGAGWVRVYSTRVLGPELLCGGKVNSFGCTPLLSWSGAPSFSGPDDFELTCTSVLPNVRGYFFWSREPALLPFMNGTLAGAPPLSVAFAANAGGTAGSCSGQLVGRFSQAYATGAGLLPGATVFGQYLYRDRVHPDATGFGLGPCVRFTFAP